MKYFFSLKWNFDGIVIYAYKFSTYWLKQSVECFTDNTVINV